MLYEPFQQKEKKGAPLNSFCETSIPKPKTPKKRKLQTISLMNTDVKILHKMPANQIQQHTEGLNTMTNWDLAQGCKIGLTAKTQINIIAQD